ncbi:MAG: amidohydrolase [Phycisphaeraceae bacterium]
MSNLIPQLDAAIDVLLPAMIELRHDLHAHPQPAFHETYASQKVRQHLTQANIPFQSPLAQTGVVAWLDVAPRREHAVALRADMDALPITEQTLLPYASVNRGQMHACGHDGHTTMLIGAALALSQLRDQLPHPVSFLFQPAEEGGGGASRMIEDGALTNRISPFVPARIFGLHGWPRLPLGQVATRTGPLMASVDTFSVALHSPGGHAAFPHLAPDPIHAASQLVAALQSIVSRNVNPTRPAVLTVTQFHGGTADNVIPDTVELGGTIRAVDEETRQLIHRRLTELAHALPGAFGCAAHCDIEAGYPATINEPRATSLARRAITDLLGDTGLIDADEPVMGAEDFSFYGRHIPACFCFLGTQRCADEPQVADLHTPKYDFNDNALAIGMKLLARLAVMNDD